MERVNRSLLYAALIVLAILYLVPVYVMLITSVKGLNEITLDKMWALPAYFNLKVIRKRLRSCSPI